MAKVIVAGDAVVVQSKVTLEDIKTVQKYAPDVLVLKDDDGEPYFKVGIARNGVGKISTYGAEFAGETHDEHKFATITMVCNGGEPEEVKEGIADTIGKALMNLSQVETLIPQALGKIADEKEAIFNKIEIVG